MIKFNSGEKAAGTITGRVMFFLMRMAFWLGVVCLLLPSSGSQPAPPDAQVNATEAVTLASAAVSDARGFCGRQPAACKVGSKVAVALGHKAEAGARTLYEFVTASINGKPATGGNKIAGAVPVSTGVEGTLTATDLKAPWHEPVPLPPQRQTRTRPSV